MTTLLDYARQMVEKTAGTKPTRDYAAMLQAVALAALAEGVLRIASELERRNT